MEKRTILAIALSFLVLFILQYVNRKYFTPEEPAQTVENKLDKPNNITQELPEEGVEKTPEPLIESAATDTKTEGPGEVTVNGELYRAVIDGRGAVLDSWILNDYKSIDPDDRELEKDFQMIADGGDMGEQWPHPGSMMFNDPNTTKLANEELYEVTVDGMAYSGMPLSPPVDVVMTLRRGFSSRVLPRSSRLFFSR